MKTLITLCLQLMMIAPVPAVAAEQRAGDFSLFDQRGDYHQMSRYNNRRGIVLLIRSSECSMSLKVARAYIKVKTMFVDLGFEFMMLEASTSTDGDRISRETGQLGLDLPVLMDENQAASKILGVRKTNEVIVYDPRSLRVIYRGSADSHLELALFSILAGEQVMNSIGNASGCEIDYGAAENP